MTYRTSSFLVEMSADWSNNLFRLDWLLNYYTLLSCCQSPKGVVYAAETKPVSSGGTVQNHSKLGWTGK